MNQVQLLKIQKIVREWRSNKEFSFQERSVVSVKVPQNEEMALVFHSFTRSFFYDEQATKVIPLDFSSKTFVTTTLSDNALIDNSEQDVNRLIKFLELFDKEIETHREEIFAKYEGKIYTSNPELWDL